MVQRAIINFLTDFDFIRFQWSGWGSASKIFPDLFKLNHMPPAFHGNRQNILYKMHWPHLHRYAAVVRVSWIPASYSPPQPAMVTSAEPPRTDAGHLGWSDLACWRGQSWKIRQISLNPLHADFFFFIFCINKFWHFVSLIGTDTSPVSEIHPQVRQIHHHLIKSMLWLLVTYQCQGVNKHCNKLTGIEYSIGHMRRVEIHDKTLYIEVYRHSCHDVTCHSDRFMGHFRHCLKVKEVDTASFWNRQCWKFSSE